VTASHITDVVAREHINDLVRDADRRRRAAEARPPRHLRLSIPRVIARRIPRAATA
jgi:hypothetical protein